MVRVEVDVTREIRTKIQVETQDSRLQYERVIYEYLPWFHLKCDKVRHFCEVEPIIKWVPKVKEGDQKMVTPHPSPSQTHPLTSGHDAG